VIGHHRDLAPSPVEEVVDPVSQLAHLLGHPPGELPALIVSIAVEAPGFDPPTTLAVAHPFGQYRVAFLLEQLAESVGCQLPAPFGEPRVERGVFEPCLELARDWRHGGLAGRCYGRKRRTPGVQLDVQAAGREHSFELAAHVKTEAVGEHQDAARWERRRLRFRYALASGEQILKPAGMLFRPRGVEGADRRAHRRHVGLAGDGSERTHQGGISPPALLGVRRHQLIDGRTGQALLRDRRELREMLQRQGERRGAHAGPYPLAATAVTPLQREHLAGCLVQGGALERKQLLPEVFFAGLVLRWPRRAVVEQAEVRRLCPTQKIRDVGVRRRRLGEAIPDTGPDAFAAAETLGAAQLAIGFRVQVEL
jgi:hypothetical protein